MLSKALYAITRPLSKACLININHLWAGPFRRP